MIRSLNERWHWQDFHKNLSELADVSDGDVVLDLGCGQGPTVPHLLERVGAAGRVTVLDRNPTLLSKIAEGQHADVESARLVIVQHDLATQLPFSKATFDVIVCQNVLECVHDPMALIAQAKYCLKPGGRILLGHHDYDGVLLASNDRAMTRQLIHGFADSIAAWQDASNGQMGRLLPGLIGSHGFTQAITETILYVDLELTPNSFANTYIGWVGERALKFGVTEETLKPWLDDLHERAARSTFYFAIPWVYVIAGA